MQPLFGKHLKCFNLRRIQQFIQFSFADAPFMSFLRFPRVVSFLLTLGYS